jgi:hypothetical protein
MVNRNLAELYGVSTNAVNQAVKRNADRVPSDFMFRPTPKEKSESVTNCDHLSKLTFSATIPLCLGRARRGDVVECAEEQPCAHVNIGVEMINSNNIPACRFTGPEKKYDAQCRVLFQFVLSRGHESA